MAKIGINYVETGEDIVYDNVCIIYDNHSKIKMFDSGDFVKDWYNCIKYLININENISYYNSVPNFLKDGAPYVKRFLKEYDGEYRLDEEQDDDSVLVFTHINTQPTWEEIVTQYNKE